VIQVHRRHRFWDVKEKQWVAGHVVVGWPEGNHGPLHRRPLAEFVNLDRWDNAADDLIDGARAPG
jgi:hypothetical protein